MLNGKTALVTGGSRGIGRAVCVRLAEAGCNVAVVYQSNTAAADEVCAAVERQGVSARAYRCDVSDFDAVKQLAADVTAHFGGVDILVNSAGITRDKLCLSMTEEDFDSVLDTNLKGAFNTIRHLYPVFMKKRSGRIINISSVSGLMGNAGQANYAAAKAGLIGLSKTVARELAARNVTCNVIAPGFIETDMTDCLPDAVKTAALTQIPMKKMGKAEDVAALVAFLASDAAAYITGEIIKIDGGLYI